MPDDPQAHARRSDPETSREAAKSVLGIRDSQWLIWHTLLRTGPRPDHLLVIAAELTHRETFGSRITPQSVRSRRAELVKLGLVEFTGKYSQTPNGGKTRVWKALTIEEYRAKWLAKMQQSSLF